MFMKFGVFFCVWFVAAIVVFGYTMGWGYSPGEFAHASRPVSPRGDVQIQAIIHPLCPCSAATLDLLRQAVDTTTPRPTVEILFSGEPQNSKNVQLANAIPGVQISFSSEVDLHKRFGNATSGHLFIWRQGRLAYSGGITDARGEQAKGTAFKLFLQTLQDLRPDTKTLPVYGCPVQGGG